MSLFIPNIGVKGLFNLLTPFDTLLLPNIAYECVAVRRLSDIIGAGGDPFADYYAPYDLDDTVYKADVEAGVSIVSLQADKNNIVYVPNTYINGFPNIGGIPYTTLALAINLGAVPDKLDLSYIKTKIAASVLESIGIEADVRTVAISMPTLLSVGDSAALEAARQARITTVTTDYAKYLEADTLLQAARQQIAELEDFIRANVPSVP